MYASVLVAVNAGKVSTPGKALTALALLSSRQAAPKEWHSDAYLSES
jgi:hypothetical protein